MRAVMREEHAQPDEVRELEGWLVSDANAAVRSMRP